MSELPGTTSRRTRLRVPRTGREGLRLEREGLRTPNHPLFAACTLQKGGGWESDQGRRDEAAGNRARELDVGATGKKLPAALLVAVPATVGATATSPPLLLPSTAPSPPLLLPRCSLCYFRAAFGKKTKLPQEEQPAVARAAWLEAHRWLEARRWLGAHRLREEARRWLGAHRLREEARRWLGAHRLREEGENETRAPSGDDVVS